QIRVLEIRYAELFQTHRSSRLKIDDQFAAAERKTNRVQKYRQKIKLALPKLRQQLNSLQVHLAQRDATLGDLRKNLSETTQYITDQGQNHKKELRDLTESYEAKIKAVENENEGLVEQSKLLGELAKEFDRIQ